MAVTRGTFSMSGVDIKYLFRSRQKDCRHLIVIFSGFRNVGSLDFSGSVTNSLRANILWIYDEFNERSSYYLRALGGLDITSQVSALIEEFRLKLDLTKSQVTFLGFSKGGTAALYHGVSQGYQNIVASVPQLRAGSFLAERFPLHLENIGGAPMIPFFDEALENAILNDRDLNRNIYLITSPDDDQYYPEALPLARLLRRYENFNLFVSETPLIRDHTEVTRYNVPILLSLLALLSEGAVPAMSRPQGDSERDEREQAFWGSHPELAEHHGVLVNGSTVDGHSDALAEEVAEADKLISRVTSTRVEAGVLFFEGFAFFRGMPLTGYSQLNAKLLLRSSEQSFDAPLAGTVNNGLSLSQFIGEYVDYSHAGLTTYAHTGLPLWRLPFGQYQVSIAAQQGKKLTGRQSLLPAPHQRWNLLNGKYVGSVATTERWDLLSLPAIGRENTDSYVEEVVCEVRDNRLFLEGYFVPRGRSYSKWHDLEFSLSLTSSERTSLNPEANESVLLAAGSRSDASTRSGEPWRDQSKAYYATLRYEGLSLATLAPGSYELYVSARYGDDVRSYKITKKLTAEALGQKSLVHCLGGGPVMEQLSSTLANDFHRSFDLEFKENMTIVSYMADLIDSSKISKSEIKEKFKNIPGQAAFFALSTYADVVEGVFKGGRPGAQGSDSETQLSDYADEYIVQFREACLQLRNFLDLHAPRTEVIVVSAHESARFRGLSGTGSFPSFNSRMFNKISQQLDSIAEEALSASVISITGSEEPIADSDHPLGRDPLHFEPSAAQSYLRCFLEKTGYRAHLTLSD